MRTMHANSQLWKFWNFYYSNGKRVCDCKLLNEKNKKAIDNEIFRARELKKNCRKVSHIVVPPHKTHVPHRSQSKIAMAPSYYYKFSISFWLQRRQQHRQNKLFSSSLSCSEINCSVTYITMYDKSGRCLHNNFLRPQFELDILVEKSCSLFVVTFLALFWVERNFVKFVANIQYSLFHSTQFPEYSLISDVWSSENDKFRIS